MVNSCCVPMCHSYGRKSNDISMFSFPKSKTMQKIWIHKLRLDTRKSKRNPVPFTIKKNTKVCSKHFVKSDIIFGSEIKKLKANSVPSVFPWSNSVTNSQEVRNNYLERKESPSHNQVKCIESKSDNECSLQNTQSSSTLQNNSPVNDSTESETASEPVSFSEGSFTSTSSSDRDPSVSQNMDFKKLYFDLLIEYNDYKKSHELHEPKKLITTNEKLPTISRKYYFTIEDFKDDNTQFQYYTGFADYETFSLTMDILFGTDRSYTLKYANCKNSTRERKLSRENEYFLVIIKLRQNYGYEHLARLFGISTNTVGAIFISWINYMYIKLGSLDFWPHRNILLENYNVEFLTKYQNVLGSIDATEIFIETPSSLVKQSQTFSHYKGHNTVKGLIVADANGAIIFVSPLYTGSISDKEIIKQCGFVSCVEAKLKKGFLQPGDTFLADKGFQIQELLNVHKININIPVFRISGIQFSPEDVQQTRVIAHERIHVERAFSRLKHYKILSQTVHISFLGTFNQIWTVCCLLANFRNPLIALK